MVGRRDKKRPATAGGEDRNVRLEVQLRANLKRRKEQARARAGGQAGSAVDPSDEAVTDACGKARLAQE